MAKRFKRRKGYNKHHLLFQRRHYAKGYAKWLREIFVYEIPIGIHDELHYAVLHDVPRPSDVELRDIYRMYLKHKEIIDNSDVLTVCEWLASACHDPAWRACMMRQYNFLKEKMGG